MVKLKIISNPYRQETIIESYDGTATESNNIQFNNPNSQLLGQEIRSGFFSFKAKEILDIIIDEYWASSEKVELEFQGSSDEFKELAVICEGGDYQDKIVLSKTQEYLENARDILPDVIEVFKQIKPLVDQSVYDREKIKRELDKFSDASNDNIPICVIGNYSSGKSTFINSLIGYELLPSSDEPTTAKIYKITQSSYEDRARIDFKSEGKKVGILLTKEDYKFQTNPEETILSTIVDRVLSVNSSASIANKLNFALTEINDFVDGSDDVIPDLIEIEAPFDDDGILGKTKNNFVIFDTPGSNSASNVKHYQVLKKAMEDLSNGLPIFVSEYDSLDSNDADRLSQEIKDMKELDNRFTMIVVNKADGANLKHADDSDRILRLAIPSKLYSGGIFFVSSILGLGAKNDEDFIDEHNAYIFETQSGIYSNPDSKFYKQLYTYNILPEQIKEKHHSKAIANANLLYVNSGLFNIEQAISDFAGIYSSYNKCQQSQLFLGKVIQITSEEIASAKEIREQHRDLTNKQLEEGKRLLLEKVNQKSSDLEIEFNQNYEPSMSIFVDKASTQLATDMIKEKDSELRVSEKDVKDVQGHEQEVGRAWNKLWGGLKDNIDNAIKNRDVSHLLKIGDTAVNGVSDILEKRNKLRGAENQAEEDASDELIQAVRELFEIQANEAQKLLESQSMRFWTNNTQFLKNDLSKIVTDSDVLTIEERDELKTIIIQYRELTFKSKAALIFDKEQFRYKLFGDARRIDIKKLTKRYNDEIKVQIDEIYKDLESRHSESFKNWKGNLVNTICDNIVELSPQLRNQSLLIREDTDKIQELETRMEELNNHSVQVEEMMSWKTN